MQDRHWGSRVVLKSERPSVVDWLGVFEVDINASTLPSGHVEDDWGRLLCLEAEHSGRLAVAGEVLRKNESGCGPTLKIAS